MSRRPTQADINRMWEELDEGRGISVEDRIAWFRREGLESPFWNDPTRLLDETRPKFSGPLPKGLAASPFAWPDPTTIPPRDWIYDRHVIRRYVSMTVSPGGVGKSSLVITESLAMTSGQPLLGPAPTGQSRVWLWNGEDPLDELQRRIVGAAMHYGIAPDDVADRLFVNSGRDTEIIVAEQTRAGTTIVAPVVEAIERTIRENAIDVVIIDPFVSSHRVPENDNGAIDRVVKLWAGIAERCNCAIELVHHSRKTGGAEVTIEDARGGSAMLAAARSARVLNRMTAEEAQRAGVDNPWIYFRVDPGKANLTVPANHAFWFQLASVPLGNGPLGCEGDSIGVVVSWRWPNPLEEISVADLRAAQKAVDGGRWREDVRARNWVGRPIAEALGLSLNAPADREKVKGLLRTWIKNGMFKVVEAFDEQRHLRAFVEVGEWAAD